MKKTKVKLLGMIQRINYMKLNIKMVIKKNFTIEITNKGKLIGYWIAWLG